jgi:hypothetical protein
MQNTRLDPVIQLCGKYSVVQEIDTNLIAFIKC